MTEEYIQNCDICVCVYVCVCVCVCVWSCSCVQYCGLAYSLTYLKQSSREMELFGQYYGGSCNTDGGGIACRVV